MPGPEFNMISSRQQHPPLDFSNDERNTGTEHTKHTAKIPPPTTDVKPTITTDCAPHLVMPESLPP